MGAVRLLAKGELRRNWPSLALLAVLIVIVNAVVLGVAIGARRTWTAPSRLMKSEQYPDVTLQLPGADDQTIDRVRHLPEVAGSTVVIPVIGRREPSQDWYQVLAVNDPDPSVGRAVLAQGRMVRPDAADEVVVGVGTARLNGLHVGSTFSYGLYTAEQWKLVLNNNLYPPPGGPHPTLTVVGLVRDVADGDARTHRFIVAGPEFARRYDTQQLRYLAVRLQKRGDVEVFVEHARQVLQQQQQGEQGDIHPADQLFVSTAAEDVAGITDVRRVLVGDW